MLAGGSRLLLVFEHFQIQLLMFGQYFGRELGLESFVQHENIFLATSEPSPVRVGAPLRAQGDDVVPH